MISLLGCAGKCLDQAIDICSNTDKRTRIVLGIDKNGTSHCEAQVLIGGIWYYADMRNTLKTTLKGKWRYMTWQGAKKKWR